jgi:hypothetical protein
MSSARDPYLLPPRKRKGETRKSALLAVGFLGALRKAAATRKILLGSQANGIAGDLRVALTDKFNALR